jgi:tRNA wybutosine-synthesizing protein 2
VLGASVPREKAEELRRRLALLHQVDKKHAIVEDGDRIVIPLVSVPDSDLLDRFHASLLEGAFSQRGSFVDPIDEIRASAVIPEELKARLPGKWELFGDVGVLRLEPALEKYESEIARAYASVLHLKTVLREVGPIQGEYRRPTMKVLVGSDTVAVHVENRILYKLDVSDIMFSSGNQEERLRMAGLRCDSETVVDMFAGIGYFSLPLAVYQKPRRVVACEINPRAYGFLVENIRLNKVESIVEPVLGDNRDLPGESIADRVIMGYVKTTHEFLHTALRLIKDGGVIHYHETCPNELLPGRPLQRLEEATAPGSMHVLRSKTIKSYAPGVSHVVLDVRVFKSS